MGPDFWHKRWQASQIGFHQAEIEPLLQRHWPSLGLAAGSTVFVPLCGKSRDMIWLAGEGHKVVGIELSEIAIDDFFAEQDLTPSVRTEAGFTVKSTGPYELWCGDFFSLPVHVTQDVAAIYDRAALIALPPDMRLRYAHQLGKIVRDRTQYLLITLEYDQSILSGPPHAVLEDEVEALFARDWLMSEVVRRQTKVLSPKFKEHGLDTVGETVHLMARKETPA